MAVKETVIRSLDIAGLKVFEPLVRLVAGEEPKRQVRDLILYVGIPIFSFALFLLIWTGVARTIHTKYGTLPTPIARWPARSSVA